MSGSGDAMGAAHAQQLNVPIRHLYTYYFKQYFANNVEKNLALAAASAYTSYVPPEYLEEVRALARGTGPLG